jgi:hypothetical protein
MSEPAATTRFPPIQGVRLEKEGLLAVRIARISPKVRKEGP